MPHDPRTNPPSHLYRPGANRPGSAIDRPDLNQIKRPAGATPTGLEELHRERKFYQNPEIPASTFCLPGLRLPVPDTRARCLPDLRLLAGPACRIAGQHKSNAGCVMTMANKERQARYRARRKAELEALRNTGTTEAPLRNDDELVLLRNENERLRKEALRNEQQPAPSRNKLSATLCRKCEGLKYKLEQCQDGRDLRMHRRRNESLRNENDELKAKIKKQDEKIKALRDSKAELLPEDIQKAQSQIKRDRTRLKTDRAKFAELLSIKSGIGQLSSDNVKLIKNCLHPDRVPEDKKEKYTQAFQVFSVAIEGRAR